MKETPVGILGIGYTLPPTVRRNDYWESAIVERWRALSKLTSVRRLLEKETDPDVRLVFQAMMEYENDPFYGAVERHVMGPEERTSDLEASAGRDALQRANIAASDIDLILSFSQLPDYLTVNTAAIVHHLLGLRRDCLALSVEGVCNSFLLQLTMAQAMIRTGQVRHALLIQSAGLVHLCQRDDQSSAAFGDGATAVVIGKVSPGHGLVGQAHRTDGSYSRALVTGVPGKRWQSWPGEPPRFHAGDPKVVRSSLLKTSCSGREVVREALAMAGQGVDNVQFYACNQPTPWYRRVTQEQIGLRKAQFVDTYSTTGSLSAGNIPLMLAFGERQGLLKDGDLVATYTSGSGITWSSLIFRWGGVRTPRASS